MTTQLQFIIIIIIIIITSTLFSSFNTPQIGLMIATKVSQNSKVVF